MFSSAKFLSPIVTAGLPTPGPLAAAAVVAVVAVLAVELVVLEGVLLLLPQAANPMPSAITANVAEVPDMNVLNLLRRLPVIRRLPVLYFVDRNNRKKPTYVAATSGACTREDFSLTARKPRGVSARCSSVSAPSTTSASTATQIAAPSTPEKW